VCRLASGVWTVCRSGHGGVCAPWACGAQTQRRGVRTMCRSCAEAFVRPGTCVVQRRKLRRSAVRQHRSLQQGEHACSDSVARRHEESGRSGGCISKEDGATARTLQLGAHCRDVQLGSGGRELSTTARHGGHDINDGAAALGNGPCHD
jgi:hypothetical protein